MTTVTAERALPDPDSWAALAELAAGDADRGDLPSAQTHLRRALSLARAAAEPDLTIAELCGRLGDVLLEAGQVDDAVDSYKDALAYFQTHQEMRGIAVCHRRLGSAYMENGEPTRARDCFEEAEALHRRLDDEAERALLQTCIGRLHEEGGHYSTALDAYRKALTINQARGDEAGTVLCLRLIGSALQQTGDLNGAVEHLNWALERLRAKRADDLPELIEVTNLLGSVLEDQGELSEAIELFQTALDFASSLGLVPAHASSLQHLASAHRSKGDFAKAIECLEEAIRLSRGLKDDVALSKLYGDLGDVYLESGDPKHAIENLKEALYRDQAHQDRLGMGVNYRRLGSAYQAQGELDRAADSFDEAELLLRQLDDQGELAVLYTERGSLSEDLGEYDKALREYKNALSINEVQRNMVGRIICLRHIASASLEISDFVAAAENAQSAYDLLAAHDDEDTPELIELAILLGQIRELQSDAEGALVHYRHALELAESIGHRPLQAEALHRIGSADCQRGNFERGRARFAASLQLLRELKDEVELAELHCAIGASYEDERRPEQAVQSYLAGLRIARRLELPPALVRLGLGLSRCYRQMNDLQRVADVLEEIREVVADIDLVPQRDQFWLEEGRLAETQERYADAADSYGKALACRKARGDALGASECQRLLSHAALARGDGAQATTYLMEALAQSPNDLRLAWSALLAQLRPEIAAAALPSFKAGDDWAAVQGAFLVCEEMLQRRLNASSRDKVTELINEWIRPDMRGLAPWADAKELAGFREFCRGAFLAQRNPQAHRSSMPISITEAAAWLSVTHLIATFLDAPAVGEASELSDGVTT